MKAVATLSLLVMLTAAHAASFQQRPEVRFAREGFVACAELSAWTKQHQVRARSQKMWYGLARKLLSEQECWFTEDSLALVVSPTRHHHATRVTRLKDARRAAREKGFQAPLFWLAREALYGGP